MFRDRTVRATRALLIALGCFVVFFSISVPEASARAAVTQHGCHRHSSASCRPEGALTHHAKKEHQPKVRANKSAKGVSGEAVNGKDKGSKLHSPTPQPDVVNKPAQLPGTVAALPRPSTPTAPTAESGAASPAAAVAALVIVPGAPLPPLLNAGPTPGSQSPGPAPRAPSAPSSAPRTPSTRPAVAGAIDIPLSQSLFGVDDSPLLVTELLVLALGVAMMVLTAGRRGRRSD